jgi:hypothetical protein
MNFFKLFCHQFVTKNFDSSILGIIEPHSLFKERYQGKTKQREENWFWVVEQLEQDPVLQGIILFALLCARPQLAAKLSKKGECLIHTSKSTLPCTSSKR